MLDDMTREELLEICRQQRKTISKLRAINFHHMVLLAEYMMKFPAAKWREKCTPSK